MSEQDKQKCIDKMASIYKPQALARRVIELELEIEEQKKAILSARRLAGVV